MKKISFTEDELDTVQEIVRNSCLDRVREKEDLWILSNKEARQLFKKLGIEV